MVVAPSLHSVVPRPASEALSSRLRHRGVKITTLLRDTVLVEYKGFYSLEKLAAFQMNTNRTSTLHQIVVMVAATLPTVCVVGSLELLRLEDPALGWRRNPTFFVQSAIRGIICIVASNIQLQQIIPEMRQPWARLLLIGSLQLVPYIATLILVAEGFDVFPVPFSNVTPLPLIILFAVLIRYCFVRDLLERHPSIKPEHQRYEALFGFTFSMVIVYSVYAFAFRSVGAKYQTLLSLALYGIRVAVKFRMWKLSHIQPHHDYSAESSACGAHLFHALFVTMCLQTARSYMTFAVLLTLAVVQDTLAFFFMRRLCRAFSVMKRSFEKDFCEGSSCNPFDAAWTTSLIQHADEISSERERIRRWDIPVMSSRTSSPTHRTVARSSSEAMLRKTVLSSRHNRDSTLPRKARVTQSLAHLMHCREVVLLHMFVDIFVPLFYLAYVALLVYMPRSNLRYYDNLASMDTQGFSHLASKVSILVGFKVLSLTALCSLFRAWHQSSGLHQLAFVIQSQRWTMQPWFILSAIQVIDFSLVHKGNDLSFQFAWLKQKTKP